MSCRLCTKDVLKVRGEQLGELYWSPLINWPSVNGNISALDKKLMLVVRK